MKTETNVNKEGIETPPNFDEKKTVLPVKTHWKKLRNPDYLGSYDFQPNEERIVTIKNVLVKSVEAEKTTDCTVVELENSKPMILNSGNGKMLAKIFETPFIEDWKGKSFKLVVKQIKAFGEVVDALRIKNEKVAKAKPELIVGTKTFIACQEKYRANNSILVKIEENYWMKPETKNALMS